MKGLLIKDFMLLKNQRQFMIIVGVFCFIFMFMNEDISFGISYMTVMFSMFTTSTISYDEYDNGMAYLFTLPVERKSYVKEKYIFGLGITLFTVMIASAASAFAFIIKKVNFDLEEFLIVIAVSCIVSILIFSTTIPLQIKFKAEKSRIVSMAACICAVALVFLVAKIGKIFGIDWERLIGNVMQAQWWILIIGCFAFGFMVMGISYMISLSIMKKKQF